MTSTTQSKKHKTDRRVGTVTSDKRNRTRRVEVDFLAKHPMYGKYLRKKTTLHVHDEANESKNGDRVEIEACRPLSKTKSWRLVRVVVKAPEV